MEKLQGVCLPYDIDDTVYYMEKTNGIGGRPKYKITKCYVYGYFNFGDGWKMKLHTSKYKYKHTEYILNTTDAEYVVFRTKKQMEERIREVGGMIEK